MSMPIFTPALGEPVLQYENPRQRILRQYADFGSFAKTYYLDDHGARIGVVVTQRDCVLLVRQWRLQLHGLSWEIPGGTIDAGETPLEAAHRECLEEAGVRCTSLEPLVHFLPGLDVLHNPTQVFLARDAEDADTFRPDPAEVVERHWRPLTEAIAMIRRGEIVCALTQIGLFAYAKFESGK